MQATGDEPNAGMLAVDSLPAGRSEQGVFHLLGNAEEWTADDAHAYREVERWFPAVLVLRGGSLATPLLSCAPRGGESSRSTWKDPFVDSAVPSRLRSSPRHDPPLRPPSSPRGWPPLEHPGLG